MRKRNLILIALIITTILVFTQIGAMAKVVPLKPPQGACVIVPYGGCSACPGTGNSCHAGGTGCDAPDYWSCCNWARSACDDDPAKIHDNTNCGMCCGS